MSRNPSWPRVRMPRQRPALEAGGVKGRWRARPAHGARSRKRADGGVRQRRGGDLQDVRRDQQKRYSNKQEVEDTSATSKSTACLCAWKVQNLNVIYKIRITKHGAHTHTHTPGRQSRGTPTATNEAGVTR